jgi:hypothetical protein
MKALFDQYGTLLSLDTTDQTIVQGSVNANTLYCAFANRPNTQYGLATVTFKRADGMISPEMVMVPATFEQPAGTSHLGFSFGFYDFWFLEVSGILEMSIRLYGENLIIAYGKITVSVQKSVVAEETYITTEQYEQMLQNIATLGIDFFYTLD